MTIQQGDTLPDATLVKMTADGPQQVTTADYFKGRKVALFSVPGAFTPTCSAKHLPSYVQKAAELRAKGIDEVACTAVNDPFVMGAWAREQNSSGKVRMMGDGSADYTKALGLEFDLTARGMGVRCQRFSMLVDDGVVKTLNVEAPGKYEVSDGETMLKQLG